MRNLLLTVVLLFGGCLFTNAQDKEELKLKDLIEKGKLDKAQEYFDKVKDDLGSYSSKKLEAVLCNAYSDKMEGFAEKNEMNNAQAFYTEIESKISKKCISELNKVLGEAYLDKKDMPNALKCTEKTDNTYFLGKVAGIYADKNSEPFDLDIALKLYKKAGKKDKIASIYLFEKNDVKSAAKYCKDCKHLGDAMLKEGKVDEAVMFYEKT